ncbi:peptide chain release factor N(5)-glutamine methyltransferase [Sphingomonas sp. 1P08PE]|uniref:peptide chain release factor N(5)-glutamine methyltransferase n=1 Tax=Sphingomonas sp. 1P08PE TaxID=554122 RepID=UPI0039A2A591
MADDRFATMSARSALNEAAARFAFSPTARMDAELLLAHALGIERNALLLDLDRRVPPGFAALVERRARHEPVAYITGTRGFWTLDLAVGPGALVPRADSETLVEAAVTRLAGRPPATILDLGVGPGTLLLALLDVWPTARGLGVDRSAAALGYAQRNATRVGGRAQLVQGDWTTAIAGRFDLVVSNPPYVATDAVLPEEVSGFEPAGALFAGPDGLDDYRRLAAMLGDVLSPDGLVLLEIGFDQAAAVGHLLDERGFRTELHRDLAGHARVIAATWINAG